MSTGAKLIILIVLIGALIGGAWSFILYERGIGEDNAKKEIDAAQKKADAKVDQAFGDAAAYIEEEQKKRQTAEGKAGTLAAQLKARGALYVANNPAFANSVCDIGPDLVRLINDSTSAMRTASIAAGSAAAVPTTAAAAGRPNADGDGGVARGSQSGGVGSDVHPPNGSIDRTGQVPGSGVSGSARPKPRPVQ